jgi:3-oxoacyl-[acyl-carrier-protein] synthase-1
MTNPLNVVGWGAVTPVGLNALQTCAAIRAKISGVQEVSYTPPGYDPVLGGVVPAHSRLKVSPHSWLVSMATRAIRECLETELPKPPSDAAAIGDT